MYDQSYIIWLHLTYLFQNFDQRLPNVCPEAVQSLQINKNSNLNKNIWNNKRHNFLATTKATKIPDYEAASATFEEYVFFKGQNVLKIIMKESRASGAAWADQYGITGCGVLSLGIQN